MATETFEEGSVSSLDPVELELFVGESHLTDKYDGGQCRFMGCFPWWFLEPFSPSSSGPRIPYGRDSDRYFIRSRVFLDDGEPLRG